MRMAAIRGIARVRPMGGLVPDRLLLVPHDLRTSDPTIAEDIYSGYFGFDGRLVTTHGQSPFDLPSPSRGWSENLFGFSWLRHLRAAHAPLARANARALVTEFIDAGHALQGIASTPTVMARRVIAFLSQSPLVLEGADHAFYQTFLKIITRDASLLSQMLPSLSGEDRVMSAMALAYAGLCIGGAEGLIRRGGKCLNECLSTDILPDGTHISRNIRLHLELITDLLPLRQAYLSRGLEPPVELVRAIDRMMPMLRLFRHGDGSLALFHGMGETATDLVATLLAYDEVRAKPMLHAPYGGYERLEQGETVVITDMGGPPPVPWSGETHASALAFELSSGMNRIVVNCGVPKSASEDMRQMVRATAAHSTLTIGDQSSCRFAASQWLSSQQIAIEGPSPFHARRSATGDSGMEAIAQHDGYQSQFGLIHERRLWLDSTGHRLAGADRLIREAGVHSQTNPFAGEPPLAVLRFHLHPVVRASRVADGRTIMLILPHGEAWSFETNAPIVTLEESVFFSAPDGGKRTYQIVVPFQAVPSTSVTWTFSRIAGPSPRGR
jgi:uncharacterized heparinase superfamily protein